MNANGFYFCWMASTHPIGVFDSGYGGLTVLQSIVNKLPQYDYLYLGDNARAPYGPRSFDTVYHYTLECVKYFFRHGCKLVVLACNTASAKALRTIQQNDLPSIDPRLRVLGVIRPTTEMIGGVSNTKHVGILGTKGTVTSQSYPIEIEKFYPDLTVVQHACPMWVPLVENDEYNGGGVDYFIKKDLDLLLSADPKIDTILLACTHYPLLMDHIKKYTPSNIKVLSQGEIVANSLADYLKRHPDMEKECSRGGTREFYTTDSPEDFDQHASLFYGEPVQSKHADLSR
jgi:glutamate racemase